MKLYLKLTKPGIIFGNLITATAGFALASKGTFQLFLAMILGLSLIIAAGCVFNNCIDREADGKMDRTKNRPLAQKLLSVKQALFFGSALVVLGTSILVVYTSLLATFAAVAGFFIYVIFYSFGKYRTVHATVIGSFAGAMPPVVGYLAVRPLDAGAAILFLMILLWQMPHFFSIAILRLEEYASASIPVLPVKRGIVATKIQILLYTLAFAASTLMLHFYGYTGKSYLIGASVLGVAWVVLSLRGFKAMDDKKWARKMFLFSLITITALSGLILANH